MYYVVPISAYWHKLWNIKQIFDDQIIIVSDKGKNHSFIHSFYIDLNYLIHFSFLIVIRGINHKSNQYLGIVKKAIDGDYSKMFPTTITSIIGFSLLLNYIVNNSDYYQILNLIGMKEYRKNNSISMNVFYSYGDFLK